MPASTQSLMLTTKDGQRLEGNRYSFNEIRAWTYLCIPAMLGRMEVSIKQSSPSPKTFRLVR